MNEAQLQYLKSQGKVNSAQENYLREVHKLPTVNKTQDFIQDATRFGKDVFGQLPGVAGFVKSAVNTPLAQQMGSVGLKTLSAIGNVVERFGAAPMRAGINEAVTGGGLTAIPRVLGATAQQFGQDPSNAPTGYQVAKNMGLSNTPMSQVMPRLYSETGEGIKLKRGSYLDPNPQGVVGAAVNLADPMVFGGPLLKGVGAGAELGFRQAGKGAKAVLGAEKAAEMAQPIKNILASGAETIAEKKDLLKSAWSPWGDKLSNITKAITGSDIKPSPRINENVRLAEKLGIKKEELTGSLLFGPNSRATKIEKTIGEGVGPQSEEITAKYYNLHNKLNEGINKHTDVLSGGKTKQVNEIAGDIKNNVLKAIKDKKASIETSYKSMIKDGDIAVPTEEKNRLLQKLSKLKEEAQDNLDAAKITRNSDLAEQSQAILNTIDGIEEYGDSYKSLLAIAKSTGKKAYNGKNIFSASEKQNIYNAITETLYKSIKDPVKREALRSDNILWKDVLEKSKTVKDKLGNKTLDAEQAVRKLFQTGNTNDINALKSFLTPEQLGEVKGSYLRELLRPVEQSAETGGIAGYKSSLSKLNEVKKQGAFKALFDEKMDLDPIKDYLKFGEELGAPIMSKSGTGPSNQINQAIREGGPTAFGFILDQLSDVGKSVERVQLKSAEQKAKRIMKGKSPSSGITTTPKAILGAIKSQPTKQLGRQVYLNTNQEEQ